MGKRRVGALRRNRRLHLESLEQRHLLAANPIINEFLASNSGVIQDEDGEYSDFIELVNQGDEAVNLAGWYLTDKADDLTKWQFPAVDLAPGQYLVVFASNKDRAIAGSQLHTNFAISVDGEYLGLIQPDGLTVASHFSPEFPQQFEDISYGVATNVSGTELLGPGDTVQVLVPNSGSLGTSWTQPGFVPGGTWQTGDLGVGYNTVPGPPPSTTVLQVDFNDRANPSLTQSGFSPFVVNTGSETQFGSVLRNYGDLSLTLNNMSSEGYQDRSRATPTNNGDFTDSLLLRDFVFSGEQFGTGGLDVVVDGLDAGATYTLTVWSFDTGSHGDRTSDWTANGIIAAEDYNFNGSALPLSNETYKFGVVVTADALGRITLAGRNNEGVNNFAVFLNALKIETGDTLNLPGGVDDVLRVDFNSRTGGETALANTEAGYETMSLEENNADFGGTIVSLSAYNGASLNDRDRTGPVDAGAFTLDQVYDDFIFSQGPAGSGMEVLVSGLAPNASYEVLLRSLDVDATGPRQSTWTEITSGATLAAPYTFDGNNTPTSNDQNAIRATLVTSPQGTLQFRGVQNGANRSVVLNAIELTRATFDELIDFDVQAAMHNQNSSAYLRVPFGVANLALVDQLLLDMQYDSGFVAYLNGQEVARRNAPTAVGVAPAFNASATLERTIGEALASETIDLTQFKHLLTLGSGNVLAFHGLNSSAGDSDFLLASTLRAEELGGEALRYFATPTPGAANGAGFVDFVSPVETSHPHGFYDDPFLLSMQTSTFGANIYYTFDGSAPAPGNDAATLYAAPILVDGTTVLRMAAFRDDFASAIVTAQTYIFLEDVLAQNPQADPSGLDYPLTWQANASGDYSIDPEVVAQWDDNNPANTDFGIREGLLSLPTMSIVMDHEDLWNASSGIYPNATSQGDSWRRPGSIEYFDPNTGEEFQYNVGVQMHGAASRDNVRTKKHSFRLIFNPEWGGGPGKLEFPLFDGSDFADINTVVLRACFTDSFATRTIAGRYNPIDSTYTRDVWMRDSQLTMGSLAPDSTYVHLYINGLYWGLYDPAERTDDAFLEARIGGEREDWDIIRDFNELYRGSKDVWNEMFAIADGLPGASDSTADAIYQELQGKNPDGTLNPALPVYLDMDNLIDYMVLHLYAGVEDWPSHNWIAARNRVDPGLGFQFFTWDQEIALDKFFRDRTEANNAFTPAELYSNLRHSSEFRIHFADSVQQHMFNNGALTVDASIDRWLQRADQIEPAIIGESARWGDAREGETINVPPQTVVPTLTVDHWRQSVADVVGFFPQYHSLAISRFTSDGLFTSLGAPLLSQFGGEVSPGFQLTLSKPPGSPGAASIYYTLDGSDPRLLGGGTSGAAILYTGPIALNTATQVQARLLNGTTWSPLVDATFQIAAPPIDPTPGDYNRNGIVDGNDYLVWTAGFGSSVATGASADGNRDGSINAADYVTWRDNLGATGSATHYPFDDIGQTYTQDFNTFRGTDQTLAQYFSITAGGINVYRGEFDSTTAEGGDFTGIMAATPGGIDYSLAWRESSGDAELEDARVLFAFTNNTGEPITGFNVSYDVEAWVNGRRDNQIRFKYDVYADSDAAQAAESRNAFESDIFATINPNHTPIAANGDQFVLDGKNSANRETVNGFVDLTTLLVDENDAGTGLFGALQPGQTAYFRWQKSNALLEEGNRSALGIDNLSITAVGSSMMSASAEASTAAAPLVGDVARQSLLIPTAVPTTDAAFASLLLRSSRQSSLAPAISLVQDPASRDELLLAWLDSQNSPKDDASDDDDRFDAIDEEFQPQEDQDSNLIAALDTALGEFSDELW